MKIVVIIETTTGINISGLDPLYLRILELFRRHGSDWPAFARKKGWV